MSNYNTSAKICEAEIAEFLQKIAAGFYKTDRRFIEQMLVGISKSESVLLSEIARASEKKVGVRKTIERFSRKLCSFDDKKFEQNRIASP